MLLVTRIYQECATAGGWQEVEVPSSDSSKPAYKVLLPPWDRENKDEIVCECPGYTFKGRCRHQHEALGLVCQWSELDSTPQTEQQSRHRLCPECHGPTRVIIDNEMEDK